MLTVTDENNSFWDNKASLILTLEILEQNEIIETDIGTVQQEYNSWLIRNFAQQQNIYTIHEEPFYMQLLLSRLRHMDIDKHLILLVQLAERALQYLDAPTINISTDAIHSHVYILVNIYKLNLIYKEILGEKLIQIASQIEKAIYRENVISHTLFTNLMVYPLIYDTVGLKSKIDVGERITACVMQNDLTHQKDTWLEKFYLFNVLIRLNDRYCIPVLKEKMDGILESEIARVFQDSHSNPREMYLLALTIHSYQSPDLRSWDEILLVPQY